MAGGWGQDPRVSAEKGSFSRKPYFWRTTRADCVMENVRDGSPGKSWSQSPSAGRFGVPLLASRGPSQRSTAPGTGMVLRRRRRVLPLATLFYASNMPRFQPPQFYAALDRLWAGKNCLWPLTARGRRFRNPLRLAPTNGRTPRFRPRQSPSCRIRLAVLPPTQQPRDRLGQHFPPAVRVAVAGDQQGA